MRSLLLFVTLIVLSACGFSPVYGTKDARDSISNIDIAVIPNREGQVVRNHLIDYFYDGGYAPNPTHRLEVSPIQENIVEIGVDRSDEASRAQLRQQATMRLIDNTTGNVVLKRTVRATSSYNILAGQYTTFVTQSDARQQALKTLADNIITQLELHFQ